MVAGVSAYRQEQFAALYSVRREAYARAAVSIDTSDLSIEEAADAAIAGFAEYARKSWAASA